MIRLRRFMFTLEHDYPNPIDRQRAVGLMVMNLALLGGVVASLILLFINGESLVRITGNNIRGLTVALCLLALPLVGLNHLLTSRGGLRLASWLTILLVTGIIASLTISDIYASARMLLVIPVVLTASLTGRRGLLVTLTLVLLVLIFSGLFQSRLPEDELLLLEDRWRLDLALAILTFLVVVFILGVFNGLANRLTRSAVHEAAGLREIVHFIATLEPEHEDALYSAAIQLIRNRLGYPFAQIYYAGREGKLNRRLRVGFGVRTSSEQVSEALLSSGNAMNQAAQTRQMVIVSLDDAAIRWSHFLPTTAQGVALPVLYRDQLLAVLDVQSEQETPFEAEQLLTLQALTDTLGAMGWQVRVMAALRENVRQQEEVAAVLQQRLQEMRASGGTSTDASWQQYMRQRGQEVFGYDFQLTAAPAADGDSQRLSPGTFISASDLPETLRPVLQSGGIQISTVGDVKTVNIPINLRGEILGAMSFTLPKDRMLTDRQIDTAQIVATRLALALENKRLFEQTQAVALRERKANEATNLLISATNVQAVMNVAASSFNEALGAINTRIHLQPSLLSDSGTPDTRQPEEEAV